VRLKDACPNDSNLRSATCRGAYAPSFERERERERSEQLAGLPNRRPKATAAVALIDGLVLHGLVMGADGRAEANEALQWVQRAGGKPRGKLH
jgi:hypothetical protein